MVTLTVSTNCFLDHPGTDLERAIKEKLTIDNPKYVAAKRYGRWIGKRLRPKLSYFESVPDGICFPRGFSNQAVLLCREITGTDPLIIDNRRLLDSHDFCFSGQLREYQETAVNAVCSRSFGVLEAGTGSGKTVMALAVIARRRQPALVVVHTKELLYQWQERAREFLGVDAGLVGDGHFEIRELTIAIVNSARKRTAELVPSFGHLIVDECHRVPATLFTDVVSCFDSYYLLGLSATAFRSDAGMTKLIYYFMGDRVHTVDQLNLKVTGAILKPKLVRRKTEFSYAYLGDYQALITALTKHEGRNRMIVDDVLSVVHEQPEGTALIVSDRLSHCRIFVDLLEKHALHVALLTGQTPAEQRSAIVNDVQNGDVQVLVATLQLISEGFDCSGLSSLFLTTPITFEGRLLQVIGRIMRPAENKTPCVYDYVDDQVSALRRSAAARQKVLANI
ncbi:MAG: DEAD/DEAH box helicase [Desulfocapsaceae bacterium]|jgi:superfamily II DNA or RNA helicase|nr:DEAD/DEAH box helicase [Desulfocapsaceae bacterium]